MSATDELRRLLDERGVKWRNQDSESDHDDCLVFKTWWKGNLFYEELYPNGDSYTLLEARAVEHITPEQAVAATVGPGTCKVMRVDGFIEYIECSKCGYRLFDSYYIDISEWNFCPKCGRRMEVDE